VLVLTALAAFLRLYRLGHLPPSLFVDEVWSSYASHFVFGPNILHWPLAALMSQFFSGQLYQHTIVGSSVFWTRFPAALFGTLCVPLTYAVGRRIAGRSVGLLAAAAMVASPWALQFSRYAVPGGAQATFYCLAFVLAVEHLTQSGQKRYLPLVVLAGVGFVSMSGSAKIFFLLFGPIYLALRWRAIWAKGLRFVAITACSLTAVVVCMGLELVLTAPPSSTGTQIVSSVYSYFFFNQPGSFAWNLLGVFYRYNLHWGLSFLLLVGDHNVKYSTGFGGELGLLAPFTYVGLIIASGRMRDPRYGVLVAWALLWPIPSSLVVPNNPNAIRGEFGLPAMLLLAAIGMCEAGRFISRRYWVRSALVSTVILSSSVFACVGYFVVWPSRPGLGSQFSCGYSTAASRIEKLPRGPVIVQDRWIVYGMLEFYGVTHRQVVVVAPGLSPASALTGPGHKYLLTSYPATIPSLWAQGFEVEPLASFTCSRGRTLSLARVFRP
jgi:4-amino-4-deoxy-L-arabinose transferase-like glycosyltransferase